MTSREPSSSGPALVYLACDIGGTNSRLLQVERRFVGTHSSTARSSSSTGISSAGASSAHSQHEETKGLDSIVDEEGCVERVLAQKIYKSENFSHLSVIINQFLSEFGLVRPHVCVAAVAGPVLNNACEMTNLNWFLKGSELEQVLGIPRVLILNDFVAVGYGLLALRDDEKHALTPPTIIPAPRAPIACLGAGTGLGECFLTHNGREYDVWPTEGGHCTFAPRNDFEQKLANYIQHADKLPTVSVERLCCGPALVKIYQYFALQNPSQENRDLTLDLLKHPNQASFKIADHALKKTDTLCVYVMDAFVKIYGAEAGNLALKIMPLGGLYIVGNVANQIVSLMADQDKFVENMVSKGRLRKDLVQIPVYLVKNTLVGLLGARVQCRRLLRELIARQMDPFTSQTSTLTNTTSSAIATGIGSAGSAATATSPRARANL